jgi:CheY-like chemotaxis protein
MARILIISNSVAKQEAVEGVIEVLGEHRVSAGNESSAFSALETYSFDLIICDASLLEREGRRAALYALARDVPIIETSEPLVRSLFGLS